MDILHQTQTLRYRVKLNAIVQLCAIYALIASQRELALIMRYVKVKRKSAARGIGWIMPTLRHQIDCNLATCALSENG